MSSPDRKARKPAAAGGGLAVAAAVAAGLALSACTVRPLYMAAPAAAGQAGSMAAEYSAIAIKPVDTRIAQQVRNQLIFLFGRGAGEPANPKYDLALAVSSYVLTTAQVQNANVEIPTSQTLVMTASYTLSDIGPKPTVVAKGTRRMPASFDVPHQQFAALRAQRDAENRAARELASQIYLSIGQQLAKAGR